MRLWRLRGDRHGVSVMVGRRSKGGAVRRGYGGLEVGVLWWPPRPLVLFVHPVTGCAASGDWLHVLSRRRLLLANDGYYPDTCRGCGRAVGEFHQPVCEYAPWHATEMGYSPRLVNVLQTRIAPVNTREMA